MQVATQPAMPGNGVAEASSPPLLGFCRGASTGPGAFFDEVHMTNKTTTEAELRALFDQGLTINEVADRLGIARNIISATASALGINARSVELMGYVSKLEAGSTLKEIAVCAGLSTTGIFNALQRAGLPTCTRAAIKAKAAREVA